MSDDQRNNDLHPEQDQQVSNNHEQQSPNQQESPSQYETYPQHQAYQNQQPPYGQPYVTPYQTSGGSAYGAGNHPPYGQPNPNEILLMEYPGNEKRLVKLASRGIRFGAYLIDSVIAGIPSSIVSIFFLLSFFGLVFHPETGLVNYIDSYSGEIYIDYFVAQNGPMIRQTIMWFIAMIVINIVAQVFFYGLVPLWTKGQTLGKKMLKLRAVSEDGHYLSNGNQIMRGLIGVFLLSLVTSGLTTWITAIMVLVTDKRQGIHDFMAGSVVISEKPF